METIVFKDGEYTDPRALLLAKHGIIESTNEKGEYEIQRIDDVHGFREYNELDFTPPYLKNDEEAQKIFKTLLL